MADPDEFKHTHFYNPIGWDRVDPKPHPGSSVISPGSPIQRIGNVGPGKGGGKLAFVHVRDQSGNNQSVARGSLASKKGFDVPEGMEKHFPGYFDSHEASRQTSDVFHDRRTEGRRVRPS